MEYSTKLQEYNRSINSQEISEMVANAQSQVEKNQQIDVYKKIYSSIDLTSLSESDSETNINEFASKVALFSNSFKGLPNVASVCVYPLFVDVVGLALGNSNVAITSVSAGFPSSQTFLEVKMLETAMAVENGADEIDVVINVGQMLCGEYDMLASEIEMLKNEVGDDIVLKVIIESGALSNPDTIYKASMLAMLSGADFIKTSTGKTAISATPEAVAVMSLAIKDYFNKTGRKVGLKVAGGVKTTDDAVLYYTIIQNILGEQWLGADLFRVGASSLANNLLSSISGQEVSYF